MKPALRIGATRIVHLFGRFAIKFPRGREGARCNLFEADLYRRTTAARRALLCPVIACAPGGLVLVMPRLEPATSADQATIHRNVKAWEETYTGPGDDGVPLERKPAYWGRLANGRPTGSE